MTKRLAQLRQLLADEVQAQQAHHEIIRDAIQVNRKMLHDHQDAANQAYHAMHKQFEELQAKFNTLNERSAQILTQVKSLSK